MITYISGDLFQSPAKVLVNTVNTVGVMGKGIALKFKQIYPEMFETYQDHCKRGELEVGKLFLYRTPYKWILNFPTKRHWRNPSRVEYIEAGLRKFREKYYGVSIPSIAFPELGRGNGELDFEAEVKPLMERYLQNFSIPTFVYLRGVPTNPPEQNDVRKIKRRLRSEPSALPFDEVWKDLQGILNQRLEFATCTRNYPFTAEAKHYPPELLIKSRGKRTKLLADELLDFWQQLRDFGLTYKGTSI